MAYIALFVKVAGDTITEEDWNQIVANFAAGVPDIFTAEGDLAVAGGADAAQRLPIGPNGAALTPDSAVSGMLVWQIQPVCRVYNTTPITPAVGTWTTLTFDSERYDTQGMHSGTVNPSRLTIPANATGLYTLGGHVEFDTSDRVSGEPRFGIRLMVDGGTVIAQKLISLPTRGADMSLDITTQFNMVAGHHVELQVYVEAAVDVLASGNYSPEFYARFEQRVV